MISKMLTDIQKRMLLFLIGCMGTRFGLAFLAYAYRNSKRVMNVMGALALGPAIGFTVIYLGGYRKTGAEVFGDKIWWNMLRPVHAMLYFTFSFMALSAAQYRKHAWMVLLLDACIGLVGFLLYHFAYKKI